jgi:nitroreductase
MTKIAEPGYPIQELLIRRWSPYGFADRDVATADLRALFEAARWAPSSYNEQPWRFIVATRADLPQFQRVLDCLWETNRAWARHAPVLVMGIVKRSLSQNGAANAAAEHDLGLAVANLSLEATARGLSVHQMIGIDPDRVRAGFAVPEDYRPLTALALGHAGEPPELAPEVLQRDRAPRVRKPLTETVFAGAWEQPADLVRR